MGEKDVFCKIIDGDLETEKLEENDELIVIKDINPKTEIHYLIIPKKHIESIADCSEKDVDLLGNMIVTAKRCADDLKLIGYKLHFNVGKEGGQEVPHIHLHLLGGKFVR